MKPNRYRRLRAQEMALRDFLAGQRATNPFPADSMEARVYAKEMASNVAWSSRDAEMWEAHGHERPQMRAPENVTVRPALEGYA